MGEAVGLLLTFQNNDQICMATATLTAIMRNPQWKIQHLSSERATEMCSEMDDLLQWWCSFGSGEVVWIPVGLIHQDIQAL